MTGPWTRAVVATLLLAAAPVAAHDGPPYPIVSDERVGAYEISIWTDPDVTDDGTPGGQFWVIVRTAARGDVPPATRARVEARPVGAEGAVVRAEAVPSHRDPSRYFAAVPFGHEGRFRVSAVIDGPLGNAHAAAEVDATYDLRPAPGLFLVYLMPFVLVGLLWLKALRSRRPRAARGATT
jgi:hypothetical protein